ncbi:hypothetical protein, partial [Aeromicrobium alkaliterrae]|uniref:hypothetical protein n=1 Tax=Aeromicrobium alkaliterrae TaxID=302168 RepID=UPI0031CF6FB6
MREGQFGEVEFVDADGAVVMNIPTPAVWDSSGETGVREPVTTGADLSLANEGDVWTLSLEVDRAWLDDPARVFPVTVDPSLEPGRTHTFSVKSSDGFVRTNELLVGNTREGNQNVHWRAFQSFDYTALAGRQVLGATYLVGWTGGTQAAKGGSVHHAHCFQYNCIGTYSNLGSYAPIATGYSTLDHGQFYADLTAQSAWGALLVTRGDESPGQYSFKHIDTDLAIYWKDYPKPKNSLTDSPPNNATGVNLLPKLQIELDPAVESNVLGWRHQVATDPNFSSSSIVFDTAWHSSS